MEYPIIFFDGVCGICNWFVNLVIKVDKKEVFRFAPLQGQTARKLLPQQSEDSQEWFIIYLDERGIHNQSDAMVEIFRRLGGLLSILRVVSIVPRSIRNMIYQVIARNRYRWFGQRNVCLIPAEDKKDRFLA